MTSDFANAKILDIFYKLICLCFGYVIFSFSLIKEQVILKIFVTVYNVYTECYKTIYGENI